MKFIGELFSYQRKKSKNHQNLIENTKKILWKDLSYIKEIDSEMNKTNTNNSKSNISKSNNNSNINKIENEEDDKENNNIIKENSKNNNENKTKIIDKDEGEKNDEDYNDYDDEFLNEINIDDNAKKENIDNNKNVTQKWIIINWYTILSNVKWWKKIIGIMHEYICQIFILIKLEFILYGKEVNILMYIFKKLLMIIK